MYERFKADKTWQEARLDARSVAAIVDYSSANAYSKNQNSQIPTLPQRFAMWRYSVEARLHDIDLAPDLAQQIGSRRWFRGLFTFLGLTLFTLFWWPNFSSVSAAPSMHIDATARDEFFSQMIMPLALGADSGPHMGPTEKVIKLAQAPERPQIERLATLAKGDSFGRMLQRAGVGSRDARMVNQLVAQAMPVGNISAGTKVDIVLGRRSESGAARPLDHLKFRARFDLALSVERIDGDLMLKQMPIRVDNTPLRIRGVVGSGLYRSARSAGAPASAVQQYLSALSAKIDIDRHIKPTDQFDIIIAHSRAATGERKAGKLLYAGVERGGKPRVQLMRWGNQGRFFEASGVGRQRSGLVAPVPGKVSSNYGMRRHPVLGYRRMHRGMDFRAGHGTPIVAVTDGRVQSAGRMGGCGNAVKLKHGGNLATRYCHMSRIAVRGGQSVRRGQVIGYVGSTGLSTGPHLHYEMYRGGKSINPASIRFVTRAQLSGEQLRQFRAALARIQAVTPGAALMDLHSEAAPAETQQREIEKIDSPISAN